MVELPIVVVIGLLVISTAATLGPRLGFAAPLLLAVAGLGASLLPFVPEVHVEPGWILSGVLPPLLYSASVSMPVMNFRREFGAISGLSFVLVVLSSLAVGAEQLGASGLVAAVVAGLVTGHHAPEFLSPSIGYQICRTGARSS